MTLLPGQILTNGVSNYIWGVNAPDFNQSFQNIAGVQAQLAANNISVIRCPVEINNGSGPVNCTDAQLTAMSNACIAAGAKMLCILRYSDLTFSDHVVSFLGSLCNLYELSNEPDLTGVTVAQYTTAWNAHVPTWRTSNPSAAFIGCALGAYSNVNSYLVPWLQNCVTSGVIPDGISFHDYPCTDNTGTIPQNTCLLNAPSIGVAAAQLRNTVTNILGYSLPICVTEWNIDAYYGQAGGQSYSTNTSANANFITNFTNSAIDSMVANNVDMACEFELNYYLVNDAAPTTPEPQLQAMEAEYVKYIGTIPPVTSNPYGYTVFWNSNAINNKLPQILADMNTQGSTWLRYQVPWYQIDPGANGNYTTGANLFLAGIDRAVQLCNQAGINLMLTIQYPPGDPTMGTGYYTQLVTGSSPACYLPSATMTAAFTQFLATRYNGGAHGYVAGYDIGNEDYDLQNNTSFVQDAGGTYLANSLIASYANIKTACPTAFVLAGAILHSKTAHIQTWLGELNTAGGFPYLDALNLHIYKNGGSPPLGQDPETAGGAGSLGFTAAWQCIQAECVTLGINTSLWITECGYGTDTVDTTHQASYQIEELTSASQSGFVTHLFPYTIGNNDIKSHTQHGQVDGQPEVFLPVFGAIETFIANNPQWAFSPPSTYKNVVLADHPKAYYRLDEASGTNATDSSGNNFTGAYSASGVTYAQTGLIVGDADQCVQFNGTTGEMTLPSGVAPAGWTAVTLEAWFSLNNTSFGVAIPLWANDITATNNKGFNLNISSGGTGIVFNLGTGTTRAAVTVSHTFTTATTYHVVATYDGAHMIVYLNGVNVGSTAFTGTIGTPTFNTAIGFNAGNSNFFPGKIDEAAIYQNVALSSTRVLAHYSAGSVGPPVFSVNPSSLTQASAGVTQFGITYTATVALSTSATPAISANWTATSNIGAMFSPASGTLTPGSSVLVTISDIPRSSGTFTFAGAENETPLVVNWTYTSPPPTNTYVVTINGSPVFVIAGTLSITSTIGKRSTAAFTVRTDTNTHFQQYQQVSIYDQSANLVFTGYITNPQETQPGFSQVLEHTITCCDQHFLADKRVIGTSYTNKTCGFIVNDIVNSILSQEGVTVGQIFDGPTPSTTLFPSTTLYPGGNVGLVPSATFVYCSVSAAMDALVKEASSSGTPYYWQIDLNKQLWFVPYTAVANTTIVDGTQIEQVLNPATVTNANPTYRNTQYITGGVAQTLTQNETRAGDGNITSWPMNYDLSQAPTITVSLNGGAFNPQSVGVKGVSTGSQYYWQQGSPDITQDSSVAKLRGSPYNDVLAVSYIGQYPTVILSSSPDQVAYQHGIDGTSGIIESVAQDSTLSNVPSGLVEASSLLARYAVQGQQLVFTTLQEGFQQGQLITVNLPMHNLNSVQMLIESVQASDQTDGFNIYYTVTAIIGPYDVDWVSFFAPLFAQSASANSINVGLGQGLTVLFDLIATIVPTASGTFTTASSLLPSTTLHPSTSLFPS